MYVCEDMLSWAFTADQLDHNGMFYDDDRPFTAIVQQGQTTELGKDKRKIQKERKKKNKGVRRCQ